MDRTLISWNLPNMITVPLMAILGWFVLGLIWQIAIKAVPDNSTSQGSGGY